MRTSNDAPRGMISARNCITDRAIPRLYTRHLQTADDFESLDFPVRVFT
jgi:hypothetical protein